MRPQPALPASSKTRRVFTSIPDVGVDDDHGIFYRIDRTDGLSNEIRIAGRIDDSELLAAMLEVRYR